MDHQTDYRLLIDTLATRFGEGLKLIVLFGSRSRGEARADSDHDIFVVIEGLPHDPLARQREVMMPLLPHLLGLPERLSLIAKTPQEVRVHDEGKKIHHGDTEARRYLFLLPMSCYCLGRVAPGSASARTIVNSYPKN